MATFRQFLPREFIESRTIFGGPLVLPLFGLQWGDEGKGAATGLLAEHFQVTVRAAGGPNAGHTVHYKGKPYALHQLPSGLFAAQESGRTVALGNGMVIDPFKLLRWEMLPLQEEGYHFGENFKIDEGAHVILPHAILEELITVESKGIGTTMSGIGPSYEHKAGRDGVRIGDLTNPGYLESLLRERDGHLEHLLRGANGSIDDMIARVGRQIETNPRFDNEEYQAYLKMPLQGDIGRAGLLRMLTQFGDALSTHLSDVPELLHRTLENGENVLIEGAQGYNLDVDRGFYPMVTSVNSSSLGMPAQIGLAPHLFSAPLGVAKWYMTKVGGGHFPTAYQTNEELRAHGYRKDSALSPEEAEELLERATSEDVVAIDRGLRDLTRNYGTSTGRPRMGGRFDAYLTHLAARRTGAEVFLGMLDTIPLNPDDRFCVGYTNEAGELVESAGFPRGDAGLAALKPVYVSLGDERLDEQDIGSLRMNLFTERMNRFLSRVEEELEAPLRGIRFGPGEYDAMLIERVT
jgi:adenylosuccinate synthase